MKILKSVHDIQAWRSQQDNIGLVPTMGALHEGHFSLVKKSVSESQQTLVSIFVNPTQFNNPDDLRNYPSHIEKDIENLKSLGVNAVFIPEREELYADEYRFKITETQDSQILEGAFRKGHFDGVLSIVMKLIMLSGCRVCYMGEKDFQQLRLIQDMVQAFFIPTKIVAVPTVREADGLAMSSRNVRLSPAAREKAPLIHKLLNSQLSSNEIQNKLQGDGFNVDYVENKWGRRLIAAEIDGVRLIDNV